MSAVLHFMTPFLCITELSDEPQCKKKIDYLIHPRLKIGYLIHPGVDMGYLVDLSVKMGYLFDSHTKN